MPEHNLTDNPTAKAISPKVTWPFILLVVGNLATVAASQDWSQENTYVAVFTVLQALAGYFVTDPARQTESV